MKSVTPNAESAAERTARDRIRQRRRANQFTVVACLIAAGGAVALAVWLPTL